MDTKRVSLCIQSSSKLVHVTSCQRARFSLMTYLRMAPTTAAHSIVVPNMAPETEAVIKSPAPTPVAAMTMPGPIDLKEFKLMPIRLLYACNHCPWLIIEDLEELNEIQTQFTISLS